METCYSCGAQMHHDHDHMIYDEEEGAYLCVKCVARRTVEIATLRAKVAELEGENESLRAMVMSAEERRALAMGFLSTVMLSRPEAQAILADLVVAAEAARKEAT